MKAYFSRYGERCAKQQNKSPRELTCANYIRLHDGGPDGCSKSSTREAAEWIYFCMADINVFLLNSHRP